MRTTLVVFWFLLLPWVLAFPCAWANTVVLGILHHEVLPALIPAGWKDLYPLSVFLLYFGMLLKLPFSSSS